MGELRTRLGTGSTDWRKSSHSQAEPESECVEVRLSSMEAGVRDSKNRQAGALTFGPGAWRTFVGGVADRSGSVEVEA
jgi:hypothetical protein